MTINIRAVDHTADLEKAVAKLTRARVLVGVPADKAEREPDDAHGAREDINNAELAYIHDQGAPEAGIPKREFMRPGIVAGKDQIAKGFEKAGRAAIGGDNAGLDQGLNRAGIAAQTAIQEKITEGPFAALEPETIKRKGSDKPLIDTGQLRRAINFVVKKPSA